jgi:flagellar biosynthesis protein FliQ
MMTVDSAVEMCRQSVMMSLMLSAPVLAAAMLAGLLISVGQAVTQLQDQTLSFVPKLLAMTAVLLFTLPWVLSTLMEYAVDVFQAIPGQLS